MSNGGGSDILTFVLLFERFILNNMCVESKKQKNFGAQAQMSVVFFSLNRFKNVRRTSKNIVLVCLKSKMVL